MKVMGAMREASASSGKIGVNASSESCTGRRRSRKSMRAIGVSDQRVGEVLDMAGIERIPGGTQAIRIAAPAAHVLQEVKRIARAECAKPFAVKVTSGSGRTEQFTFTPESVRTAAEQVERDSGARLEVVYQMPNQHRVNAAAAPIQRAELRTPARPDQHDQRADQRREAADLEPRTLAAVEDTGYTPEWVIGQLTLRLERHGETLVNPRTGEIAPVGCSPRQLIELVIGRKLRTPDPLMSEIASVGGIVKVSE